MEMKRRSTMSKLKSFAATTRPPQEVLDPKQEKISVESLHNRLSTWRQQLEDMNAKDRSRIEELKAQIKEIESQKKIFDQSVIDLQLLCQKVANDLNNCLSLIE